ncbi:hypothetical protein OESDEN_09822 [Oesophagostomum dentatum]|uniref:Uncharacterized protein n=1 Tax=Oesophagostomum dentatum TaxID=61180 RepID=A0A0B1SYF6_OESDE|nr:hypothetical protein OESDEN_09822 [Oesophagostomum dentatum]
MFFPRKKDKDPYTNNNNNDYATIVRKSKPPPPPPDQKLKNNTLSIVVPPPAVDPHANANSGKQPKLQRPQRIRSPPRPLPPRTAPPSISSTYQYPVQAEAPQIPAHKEREQCSVPVQNCPPVPSRPPTVVADLAKRTNTQNEESNSKPISPPEELAPPPRQISPGNLYKPTAPPRPSAPRTKIITVDTNEEVSNNALEDGGAVFQLSHTTAIAILPSPEAKKENTSIERHGSGGVLAKRHSIKINTNAIVEPDSKRKDATMLPNGSSGEHSVIINRL